MKKQKTQKKERSTFTGEKHRKRSQQSKYKDKKKKEKKEKLKRKRKKRLVEEILNLRKETQTKSERHEESNRKRSVEGNKAGVEDKRKEKKRTSFKNLSAKYLSYEIVISETMRPFE